MKKLSLTALAVAGTLSMGVAQAAENPFALSSMEGGYMQVAAAHGGDAAPAEGKCGGDMKKDAAAPADGKCGGDMKKDAAAPADGKCGEGKCGGDKK